MRGKSQIGTNTEIPGWTTEKELSILDSLASTVPTGGIIVEAGAFCGRSSYCLAKASSESTVYCIDTFTGKMLTTEKHGHRANTIETLHEHISDCANIRVIAATKGVNVEWPRDTLIDMFFLDASHHNPSDWQYIEFWLPKIRPGGILCGHDYGVEKFPDVAKNVSRLETLFGKPVTTYGDNSWIWSFVIK